MFLKEPNTYLSISIENIILNIVKYKVVKVILKSIQDEKYKCQCKLFLNELNVLIQDGKNNRNFESVDLLQQQKNPLKLY